MIYLSPEVITQNLHDHLSGVSAPPSTSYVTLDKLLYFSKPQDFLVLKIDF